MTVQARTSARRARRPLRRRDDWPQRLHDYIRRSALQTFALGRHDCMLFAAGAIQAMTGVDLGEPFRGRYSSELTAAKVMRRYSGGGILETLDKLLDGHEFVAPGFAQRGDLVYLDYDQVGPTAAILGLGGMVVTVGKEGLIYLPAASAVKAWRI